MPRQQAGRDGTRAAGDSRAPGGDASSNRRPRSRENSGRSSTSRSRGVPGEGGPSRQAQVRFYSWVAAECH